MKASDVVSRCVKARVVSWLTNSQQAAVIPTTDGGATIIAVYSNGRYVEPEFVSVPDDVSSLTGEDKPEEGESHDE